MLLLQKVFKSVFRIVLDFSCLLTSVCGRAVDPHSLNTDPDPAVFLNADPDPDPDPDPGPGLA